MMNSELLERNCGERFPEELDNVIDMQAAANCVRFNRWGTMFAAGTTDGKVFIVDFLTRATIKTMQPHLQPVTSLGWSRDGRWIISSSADHSVAIHNVLTGMQRTKLYYNNIVISAQFNPRNENQFLAHITGQMPSLETIEPKTCRVVATDNPHVADDTVSCCAYDRRGQYIITGTTKGRIVIYDSTTLKLIAIVKQNSVQQIRNIVVPRRGCFILTNSQDRVIRRYDLDELIKARASGTTVEPIQKLSDIVNKTAWKTVCCSYDGVYICGGSTKSHSLYIWERGSGSLIKMLSGPKGELLHDAVWHPSRSVILSVANGKVYVWTQSHVENWSAFAPEFTELEENSRYTEKEGEFDVEDEDAEEEEKEDDEDEDMDIDVVNLRADELQCSSDEEDLVPVVMTAASTLNGPLYFIPVTPDVELPEMLNLPVPVPPHQHADVHFHRQPQGGGTMVYEDPNDLRYRTNVSTVATAMKPVTKVSRRAPK